jgi:hypothetical protein
MFGFLKNLFSRSGPKTRVAKLGDTDPDESARFKDTVHEVTGIEFFKHSLDVRL